MSVSRDECPRCGAPGAGEGECPQCATGAGGAALRLLPSDPADGAPPPAEVRIVREFKGPTVKGLLGAPPGELDRLPGRVRSMAAAIEAGDLAAAEQHLDGAVGRLIPGPGHRPEPSWGRLRRGLVGLLAATFAALVWWMLWRRSLS